MAEVAALFGFDRARSQAALMLIEPFLWTLFFEIGSIVSLGFAFRHDDVTFSKAKETVSSIAELDLTEVPKVSDHELDELRRLLRRANAPLTNQEVADLMSVTKAEASKRVSKAVAAGFVSRAKVGREVAIRLA